MPADRMVQSQRTTPSSTSGSRTATSTEAGPSLPPHAAAPVLRLRAQSGVAEARRIQWAEDVVDNEGMGKKSSKVCCIYHKPKTAGDSSSDESSSESESSDGEPDLSRAQPARRRRGDQHDLDHNKHIDDQNADASVPGEKPNKGKGTLRDTSPNAYERVPRRKKDKT